MRRAFVLLLFLLVPSLLPGQSLPAPAMRGNNITVTPTGATGLATSLEAVTAQQGVLLDTFKLAADPDDTLALNRAVAAGVPIILGPKTYLMHDVNVPSTAAQFILRGIPDVSRIQRTSGTSSSIFFAIRSPLVVIDGVTFDMNRAAVSANQWGVFLPQGGQTVTVRNSVFKGNSGTLGSCFSLVNTSGNMVAAGGSFVFENNEVTDCSFNALYFGSVTRGRVTGNHVHDTTGSFAIFAGTYGAASATNYLEDVIIESNRLFQNSGTGISVGGIAPPYIFGTPSAKSARVTGNTISNSTNYGISIQGEDLAADGNTIRLTSGTAFGAINCYARRVRVTNNMIDLPSAPWGIDCGGSIEQYVAGNDVTMTAGAALNVGGSVNGRVIDNKISVSGTASAITIIDVESDGALSPMPQVQSGLLVQNNKILIAGTTARGIAIRDNAGGRTGTNPTKIFNNEFMVSGSGTGPYQDIEYYASGAALRIEGNTHNGQKVQFVDPNGNGDIVADVVFDEIHTISSTASIRTITTSYVNTFGFSGSILWVVPATGGTGYTAATTTLSASSTGGGTGWTGTALISQGIIVGVRTLTLGSGYSGTITITATSSVGGSGATFTSSIAAQLPAYRPLQFMSVAGNLVRTSGAGINLLSQSPIQMGANSRLGLVSSTNGTAWYVDLPPLASFASTSLPTCNATAIAAQIIVTGSASGKWMARCNGTSWVYSDGTSAP